mgnify:CR=1 FL=1
MIVDFHQHPYPGVHEFMQQNHITVTVLLPGPDGNEIVLKWARKWPGQFIPFYWVDLDDPARAADDLEVAVRQKGHRGIKFQPLVQRFYPNEKRLGPIFATARRFQPSYSSVRAVSSASVSAPRPGRGASLLLW